MKSVQLDLFEQLGELEKKEEVKSAAKSILRVWYGFSRITKKAVKKRELAIYFENCYNLRSEAWVERRMHIAAVRKQSMAEAKDGIENTRSFTKYSIFLDSKPFNGDIHAALQYNYDADSNNVTPSERKKIRGKLLETYKMLEY